MSKNPCFSNESETTYLDILHDIEIAGYRYVILTICVFGIVCNVLNLCVLLQRRLKESPYTYLTGLAIADMFTLIFISPFAIVRGDYIHHETIVLALVRFEKYFYMPIANYFGQVSIMITLALTIERYLFTTYPLHSRRFCQPRYARVIMVNILVICAILSFPRFLIEKVEKNIQPKGSYNSTTCRTHPFVIEYSSTNSTHIGQCICISNQPRELFTPYRNIYFVSMFIFNQILPAIVLIFLNLKLIRRVRQSNHHTLSELVARQHRPIVSSCTPIIHSSKQKRLRDEHRLTKTLVSIVVVFLVCNTFTIISYPDFMKRITRRKYPNYISTGFRIQILVTNMMLILNYSVNFFFYCAFNQKFLDTLKALIRHRFCSYFHENYNQRNGDLTAQRTLFRTTTSPTTSSWYIYSNTRQSSKRYSNHDEGFRRSQSPEKTVVKNSHK